MELRPFLEPSGQQRTLHKMVLALTDDAGEADELAPIKPDKVTDTVLETAQMWGSLMTGVDMPLKEGGSHREAVTTLLKIMDTYVQRIVQTNGVGTPQDVIGLTNAAVYVGKHLKLLSQDESEQQFVKQAGDVLGKIGNEVKAMVQRQQEQAAQQNGHQDPETMAKVQAIAMTTQAKVQAKQVSDAQKLQQKEAAFRQKQQHEMEKTRADIFTQGVEGVTEAQAVHATTAAEVKAIEKRAEAEAKAASKKAAATPAKT